MTLRAVCLVCGDPMEARRSTRRYCSTRCRVKAAREAISVTPPPPVEPTGTLGLFAAPAPSAPAPAPIHEATPPPRLPLPIEVRHVPGERLSNGHPSGLGGSTTYHVGGRSFDTPRAALDFAGR
jgi:hypothetical protein